MELLAFQAHAKEIILFSDLGEGVPFDLRGDPGRLRQIFINLLGNAIKFTDSGEICLGVKVIHEEKESAKLRFSVKDTGIGISASEQELLFESFTQVDNSHARKYGGTGLGLAICKKLVSMMNGTLGVCSEKGVGTEFWFEVDFNYHLFPVSETLKEEGDIFLAVPECPYQVALLSRLNRAGYNVSSVFSEEDLVAKIQESDTPPRAIIADSIFPEWKKLPELLQHSSSENVPLVLIIPLGDSKLGGNFSSSGYDSYVTRPVPETCIKHIFERAISGCENPGVLIDRRWDSEVIPDWSDSGVRILIAEDNLINQKVALGMLSRFGLGADVVGSGRELLEQLKLQQYDLVLLDLQMPEMDGMEAARLIRSGEERVLNKDIVLVAMTAHAMRGYKEQCLNEGMNDFISKPVDMKELQRVIHNWVLGNSKEILQEASNAQTTALDHGKVLDYEGALDRMAGDKELLFEMWEDFLRDTSVLEEEIILLWRKGDYSAMRYAVHTLKSTTAAVGGDRLSIMLSGLESDIDAGRLLEAESKLQELEEMLEELFASIEFKLKAESE
jgi:CheY-like chemotaxis protein/HPt (histidine-containing phosphotransfer) domain-containing protein